MVLITHTRIQDQNRQDLSKQYPALASGYPQNRIQDSNASSQMYLRRRTTISFRLDKNQRELAVSVEIIPGHTPNGQYL